MAQATKDTDSVLFSKHGMLHCGAEIISASKLRKLECPAPQDRWHPIPHHTLADEALENLAAGGYSVKQIEHSVSHNGNRYFGLIEMETSAQQGGQELSRIVGLRNAHDKKFRAQLVTGTGVFVCDNLSFCGQISVGRRHTTHILRDLPILMGNAVGKLGEVWADSEMRVEAYKDRTMELEEVHDIVCRALKMGALPSSKIKPVLQEYKEPRHDVFAPDDNGRGTAWSFFNAFTEIGKAWPLQTLQNRTMRMHGLVDNYLGLDIKPIVVDAELLEIENDKEADVIVTTS